MRSPRRTLRLGRYVVPLSRPEMTALRKSKPFWKDDEVRKKRAKPVALHGRRQRQRGFNQALVLARFGVAPSTGRVQSDLLRRTRWTGQQAKLDTAEARQANVAGAFAVRRDPVPGAGRRIGLVDDLVTGGTTCDSAVAALRASGWQVSWVVALGLAGGEAPSNEVSGTDRDRQVDSAPMEF